MRPFLLLGDLTNEIVTLALIVVAIGGLMVYSGIKLRKSNPSANNALVGIRMALGFLVMFMALLFLLTMPGL